MKSLPILSFLFALSQSALAATKIWDGGAGTGNWADANNWNANGVPAAADQIYLATAVPKITMPDVANCGVFGADGPVSATLLGSADLAPVVLNLYGITGKPLMYIGPNCPPTVMIDNVILQLYTSGQWWIDPGKTLRIRNNGSIAITQSGNRGLTKTGAGTLRVENVAGITGQVVINAGTLALGADGRFSNASKLAIASGAFFDVTALTEGFCVADGQVLGGKGTVSGYLTTVSGATVSTDSGIASESGPGTLTITNGFTLASGAHLALRINAADSYDAVIVSGGNVTLAGDLAGTTFGYTPSMGGTFYIVRNNGSGSTIGTLGGAGDGDTVDWGGMRFRVSLTSDYGGSGFAVGGTGNDVAIQRIESPPQAFIGASADGASVRIDLMWEDWTANETGYQIYRVLADGALEPVAELPASSNVFSETVPNYASYTYAVQAIGADGPLGSPKYSDPLQAGSSLAQRKSAMINYLGSEQPDLNQVVDGPHRIGRVGFWNGEARLLRGDTANGLSYITAALEDADPSGVDNPGFSMWPGMDAWFRWNHLFPQSLKDRYKAIYTYSPHYNTGATPNQRFMLCVAAYLAYGVWGNDMFLNSGAYYGTSDPTGKTTILNVLNTTPWKNFEEHNSNHYLQYSLAPMETLALYAPDAEVREKARMVVDWSLAEAAGYWHNGHWCVSSTRGGANAQQYDYDITPWTWRMLFGGPSPYNYADSHATLPFAAPEFPGMLPELETVGRDRTRSYTRRSFAQRSAGAQIGYFKQAWMTPKYALWSQAEGTVGGYNADGSIILGNMNTVAIQDGYQGQRWALAWDSPPDGDSVFTITTPTNYGTATGTGISIYEDTLQKEDTMIAVYNIPAGGGSGGNNGDWPNQYLKGHIPAGYTAITDEAASTGRIFLHYNSVLLAIYLSNPFSWSTNFTTACTKAGLAIETAPVSEFPQSTAAERLAAFRAAVLANAPNVAGINSATPRFVYTNRHGRVLDLTYGYAGVIDGISVDYQSWPMLEDPWIYQSQRGHLHIFGKNRTIVSNYYNWTKTINNRPVLSPSASVPANGPVDIDLASRVEDSETPDAKLNLTVARPVNGAVQLLGDGHTARFTPSAGFTGAASFGFTARDRGIHPRLIWNYDFEPPADLVGGTVPDASGTNRAAWVQAAVSGTATLESTTPGALGANSTCGIRLDDCRLACTVSSSTLEMSNGSWTFATWFKRASNTSDDFILYLGSGDGFGDGGGELHLHCPAGSDTLRLMHYHHVGGTNDVLLTSPATATTGQWHHAAVTFEKTADYTGILRLWLDGVPAGEAAVSQWYLAQDQPLVIGGHASITSSVDRCFDGWLDDAALFRGALSPGEIASLATQSIATFGGLDVSATVDLSVSNPVLSPLEIWRQTYFGTTANTGTVANDFDADADGLVNLIEYALGSSPVSAADAPKPVLAKNGSALQFSFLRARADLTYIVEGSSDLSTWTAVATNPGTFGQTVTVDDSAGGDRRFMRLRILSTP